MKLPVEPTSPDSSSSRPRIVNTRLPDSVRRINTTRTVDYSEYMWMGEEMEEFDKQCLEEFLEEEFISQCFEEMLEEEDEVYDLVQWFLETYGDDEDMDPQVIMECLQSLAEDNNIELTFLQDPTLCRRQQQQQQQQQQQVNAHKLNPNAPEFIPQSHRGQNVSSTHPESPTSTDR